MFSRRRPSPFGLIAGSSKAAFDLSRCSSFWSVREEEERLVALDRPAERPAELVLAEVLVLGAVGVLAEQGAVAAEVERGALVPVGAALRHHVDEAAHGAAELGRGAVGDDLELLHRLEADDVLRTLAAALFPEERVVGVGAVDHHVVVDAALAVDADLGPVRPLDDADGRRQLHEVDEVAAVDRQLGHRLLVDQRRLLGARRLDHRRAALDGDAFTRGDAEREVDAQHAAEREHDLLAQALAEAAHLHRDRCRSRAAGRGRDSGLPHRSRRRARSRSPRWSGGRSRQAARRPCCR